MPMPKYPPNSRFSDCWSSVGNITFFHRNGVCYYKNKPVCKFKGTPDQMRTSEVHRRALAGWRTLTHETQLQWNEYAREVPSHRPPFDGSGHITGHNLFVSAYHGFAQLDNEHIPEPVKWTAFPIFSPELIAAGQRAEDLVLTFQVNIRNRGASAHRLHLKLQLTSHGSGVRPGLMRTFVAEQDCNADLDTATITIPDYHSNWKLPYGPLDAHCRFSLIDSGTGYRSQYLKRKLENIIIQPIIP